MQACGGPKEDDRGNFRQGGRTAPYFDEASGRVMAEQMGHSFDLLLGRKTFEIPAAFTLLESRRDHSDRQSRYHSYCDEGE